MKDYLVIGKLGGAHGVRGELRVFPLTDDVRRFRSLKSCILLKPDETRVRDLSVVSQKVGGDQVIIQFDAFTTREDAAKWNGYLIAVPRQQAVALPADRYFISDLIGCNVSDSLLGDLGSVSDILETGSNDVFVVKRTGKQDLLIPFLKRVVKHVDIQKGLIQVELPEGLFEIYES